MNGRQYLSPVPQKVKLVGDSQMACGKTRCQGHNGESHILSTPNEENKYMRFPRSVRITLPSVSMTKYLMPLRG